MSTVYGFAIDTRARRRLVVASMYGSYLILCAGGALARSGSGGWAAMGHVSIGLAGMLLFACWTSLVTVVRGVVLRPALVRAYCLAAALIGLLCVYRLAAHEDSNALLFGVIFFVSSLPWSVVVCTQPDPAPCDGA